MRRLPPQARRAGRNSCTEKGVQRETCSIESVARRLVYDGADVVGWCRFGPPAELPARVSGYGRLDLAAPDWRITCFFVDRDRRREGIAKTALEGALRIIATKGGGTVDGYPIAIPQGKPYSNNFLWSGAASMFAELGFRRLGNLGSSKLVMRKVVRGR